MTRIHIVAIRAALGKAQVIAPGLPFATLCLTPGGLPKEEVAGAADVTFRELASRASTRLGAAPQERRVSA